jgi:hypothetical protein
MREVKTFGKHILWDPAYIKFNCRHAVSIVKVKEVRVLFTFGWGVAAEMRFMLRGLSSRYIGVSTLWKFMELLGTFLYIFYI